VEGLFLVVPSAGGAFEFGARLTLLGIIVKSRPLSSRQICSPPPLIEANRVVKDLGIACIV